MTSFEFSNYLLCSLKMRMMPQCNIKIFRGEGVVDGEGGGSEGCLKWGGGGGGSLKDLSKNILKQGVGRGRSCS